MELISIVEMGQFRTTPKITYQIYGWYHDQPLKIILQKMENNVKYQKKYFNSARDICGHTSKVMHLLCACSPTKLKTSRLAQYCLTTVPQNQLPLRMWSFCINFHKYYIDYFSPKTFLNEKTLKCNVLILVQICNLG